MRPLARLRGAQRDPRDRRDAGGERALRRGARARARAAERRAVCRVDDPSTPVSVARAAASSTCSTRARLPAALPRHLASGLGTWLAFIALTVDVYDRTRLGRWVARSSSPTSCPLVVIGLLLGPLVDRFSRRKLMIASDLVRLRRLRRAAVRDRPARDRRARRRCRDRDGFFRPAVYAGCRTSSPTTSCRRRTRCSRLVENLTWMSARSLGGAISPSRARRRVLGQRGDVPRLGAADRPDPGRKLQTAKRAERGHWRDLAGGSRSSCSSRAAADRARRLEPRDARDAA